MCRLPCHVSPCINSHHHGGEKGSKRDFIKIVRMVMVIKEVLEEEEDHPICVVALFSVTSALRFV